jgi:hypothetical protein
MTAAFLELKLDTVHRVWYSEVILSLTADLQVSIRCTMYQNLSGVKQDRIYAVRPVNFCSKFCYRLDGPGIESPWGARFSALVQNFPGVHPVSIQWLQLVFLGVKEAGAWHWPPIQSSAEVKERFELYPYFPSGTLWPVIGWTLQWVLRFIGEGKQPSRFSSNTLQRQSRCTVLICNSSPAAALGAHYKVNNI